MTRNVSGTAECLHPARKFPANVTSSLLEEGGRERRQRVCRSWTGYGTVVSDRAVLIPQQQQGGGFSLRNTIRRATSLVIATPWKPSEVRRIDVRLMPSLKSLVSRRSNGSNMGGSSSSSAVPLMKKEASCSEIPAATPSIQISSDDGMRKCETMLALSSYGMSSSRTALQVEPLRPVNRLRVPPTDGRMCSRCSSLLSMASSSRYSLNTAGGGFVPSSSHQEVMLCKLCLGEVPVSSTCDIAQCGCAFCKDCMKSYVEFEIQEGAYDISCPDAQCKKQGVISQEEIANLVSSELVEKHNKFRLNREVDLDVSRTWCPRAGCETVCSVCGPVERCLPQSVHCPTCSSDFCSNCKNPWHAGSTCEENSRRLAKEDSGIPFDSDLIKCCPMCNVPIEKDEGCAQMMCKRCKHVFCWYCLASLDDDFLLRHYDKGPCKNKLGHSRASVIWHRTQVIGIFAGFGILLLVASPLLLLAAPCIVCCKCRVCSGSSKLDEDDVADESAS